MTDFISFAAEHGLILDGVKYNSWMRVPTVDHPHKRNGAYFHGGEYAHIQNWGTMDSCSTWFADKPTCPIKMAELNKRIAASQLAQRLEQIKANQEAAKKADFIISQCRLDRHAYLGKKGFPKMNGKVWHKVDSEPLLVIPMYFNKRVCGVQLINEDGRKKFLKGSKCGGAVHQIGSGGITFLVEGYATALSLHTVLEAIKQPSTVLATFSAGNMSKVAKLVPNCILICDNDKSGTGEKVGKESSRKWWMPEQVGFDFNDLLISRGLFKTSQILRGVIK